MSVSLKMSEKELQDLVLQLARLNGYLAYHTYDSRRSESGFPDLVLVGHGDVMVVELKSQRGKVRPEQHGWLEAFAEAGIEAHVWRPEDFESVIVPRLKRKRRVSA